MISNPHYKMSTLDKYTYLLTKNIKIKNLRDENELRKFRLMGKRNNTCSRSVLTCDPPLDPEEIGIPLNLLSTRKKVVTQRELNFYICAKDESPLIKQIIQMYGDYSQLITENFPMTLSEYVDQKMGGLDTLKIQIKNLISELHKKKIIHGDLHSSNIVINPLTNSIKLIDYGRSYHFNEVTPEILKSLTTFLEPEQPFTSLEQLQLFEMEMYLRDF